MAFNVRLGPPSARGCLQVPGGFPESRLHKSDGKFMASGTVSSILPRGMDLSPRQRGGHLSPRSGRYAPFGSDRVVPQWTWALGRRRCGSTVRPTALLPRKGPSIRGKEWRRHGNEYFQVAPCGPAGRTAGPCSSGDGVRRRWLFGVRGAKRCVERKLLAGRGGDRQHEELPFRPRGEIGRAHVRTPVT